MGIIKPKPTDLSHVPGLVAAYNMVPSPGGILCDISGNGRDITLTSAPSSNDGIVLNKKSVISNPSVFSGNTYSLCFRVGDVLLNKSISKIVGVNLAGVNNSWYYGINGAIVYRISSGEVLVTSAVLKDYSETDVCIVADGVNMHFYVNGVYIETLTPTTTQISFSYFTDTLYQQELEYQDLRIYNYAFSEQEAKLYHQSFEKVVKKGNFTIDHGVGDSI